MTGLAVVGGVAASGTAAAGTGDGRVGHYTMNSIEDDGTVHDASPAENHGTNHGATVVEGGGAVGNAFEFDGDDHIAVDYGGESPEILENWTVSGRISPADWGDDDRKEWLSVTEDRTTTRPLDFVHEAGKIKHYRGQAAGEVMAYDVSEQSGWHHMLVTQERVDSSTVDLVMYLDGSEVATASGDYENMRPGVDYNIGRIAGGVPDRFYWDGKIGEIRVYDRVLSDEEIESLATTGGNGNNGNGDEGDSSSNSRDDNGRGNGNGNGRGGD